MVGGARGRVKAVVALALIAGCFSWSYGREVATHAEVLVAMAHKGADLVAGGRLTAESLPELTYPLERAQAFVRAREARGGAPPPSLVELERLIDRYRAFLDALDRVRREQSGDAARAALSGPLAAAEAAGAAVREALRAEGRL